MAERSCIVCSCTIPEARLNAIPDATACVQCVVSLGDVPRIKRHDDYDMDLEECSETLYYENEYFEQLNKIRGQIGYLSTGEERMS